MQTAETLVEIYLNQNGWSDEDIEKYTPEFKEYKKSILNMYILEIKHIREMKEKLSQLSDRTFFDNLLSKFNNYGIEKMDKEYFEFQNEEELALKVINKINSEFNSLINNFSEA